jgi:hypothetical protein
VNEERTIYQTIAARAFTDEERRLLEARRRALLIELSELNRALGLATETRKERRAGTTISHGG